MAKPGNPKILTSTSTDDPVAEVKRFLLGQRDRELTTEERLDEVAVFLAGQKGGGLSGLSRGLNITVTVQVQIPAAPKVQDDAELSGE